MIFIGLDRCCVAITNHQQNFDPFDTLLLRS